MNFLRDPPTRILSGCGQSRLRGWRRHRDCLSGSFAKSRTWPLGPTNTQRVTMKVPALTQLWLKVKRKEQSPRARRPCLSPFSLSGINFPTCKSGQLGGRHSGTLEVRWRGLTSDLSHIHTARGDRSSPDGLYVAHTGFSHLKCELSFKHPRSLPQHPGFQVLKKTN